MKREHKKIISVLLCAGIAWIVYYGTWLPLKRSVAYISASRELSGARRMSEVKAILLVPLEIPSPVGEREIALRLTDRILGIIRTSDRVEVTDAAIAFVHTYYDPVIADDRGAVFAKDIFVLGLLHEQAYLKTGNPKYLAAARGYYNRGLALSPARPEFLYGALKTARAMNDLTAAIPLAEKIVRYWPGDTGTASILRQMEEKAAGMQKEMH